jgi:preprotein translocase subunit SecA
VTIATNMAGRGVDILLGGNPDGLARDILRKKGIETTEATPEDWAAALQEAEAICKRDREVVLAAGGLYVLGTERHEARRIDNQLRGRSGRQGDPGESRFYLSLEDDLMRRFGGDRVKKVMDMVNLPEDQPIESGMISKSIHQAQVRVEGHNFDIRKRVLEYDDVVNKQREDIYRRRREILESSAEELREKIQGIIAEEIDDMVDKYLDKESKTWELEELYRQALTFRLPEEVNPARWDDMSAEDIENDILKGALKAYDNQVTEFGGSEQFAQVEREVFLRIIDELWVRHLTDLAILREGIGLESIRQRDPLVEYQIQGFEMYHALLDEANMQMSRMIYRVEIARAEAQQVQNIQATRAGMTGGASKPPEPVRATSIDKLGRNDPCHCGSGKKYKHCHYREDQAARQTVDQTAVKRSVKRRR